MWRLWMEVNSEQSLWIILSITHLAPVLISSMVLWLMQATRRWGGWGLGAGGVQRGGGAISWAAGAVRGGPEGTLGGERGDIHRGWVSRGEMGSGEGKSALPPSSGSGARGRFCRVLPRGILAAGTKSMGKRRWGGRAGPGEGQWDRSSSGMGVWSDRRGTGATFTGPGRSCRRPAGPARPTLCY